VLERNNRHNYEKGYRIDYSIDPETTLSILKKRVLLKYSKRDSYLLNLKEDLIKNGRTLFFPYCGLENLDYLKGLDYQNFIVADSQLKFYSCENFNMGLKRLVSIDLDPLMVMFLMLELNIKISCFVGIKDDIYPENFSFLLEMSIPLLSSLLLRDNKIDNKLIYISSKTFRIGFFKEVNRFSKKLPFKCKFNIRTDFFVFFPDKELNDIYKIWGKDNDVFQMDLLSKRCKVTLINGKRVFLVQDSIWSYIEILDIAFIDYDNSFQQSIVNMNYNYVYDVRGKYETMDGMELDLDESFDIQVICNMLNAQKIGFTKSWNTQEQIKILLQKKNKITDIYLFCPDKDDYNEFFYQHYDVEEDDDK